MATTQTATNYRLADPADVRSLLENYSTSVTSSEALPNATPQPALNGKRVLLSRDEADPKKPEDNMIYFVWGDGSKCWIPNRETFDALFTSTQDIILLSRVQLESISRGPDLSDGAATVRGKGQVPNYFVSNNHKHYVTNQKVLAYCHLRGAQEIPRAAIEAIPRGFDIDTAPEQSTSRAEMSHRAAGGAPLPAARTHKSDVGLALASRRRGEAARCTETSCPLHIPSIYERHAPPVARHSACPGGTK